jgi:hypothetical protein
MYQPLLFSGRCRMWGQLRLTPLKGSKFSATWLLSQRTAFWEEWEAVWEVERVAAKGVSEGPPHCDCCFFREFFGYFSCSPLGPAGFNFAPSTTPHSTPSSEEREEVPHEAVRGPIISLVARDGFVSNIFVTRFFVSLLPRYKCIDQNCDWLDLQAHKETHKETYNVVSAQRFSLC